MLGQVFSELRQNLFLTTSSRRNHQIKSVFWPFRQKIVVRNLIEIKKVRKGQWQPFECVATLWSLEFCFCLDPAWWFLFFRKTLQNRQILVSFEHETVMGGDGPNRLRLATAFRVGRNRKRAIMGDATFLLTSNIKLRLKTGQILKKSLGATFPRTFFVFVMTQSSTEDTN